MKLIHYFKRSRMALIVCTTIALSEATVAAPEAPTPESNRQAIDAINQTLTSKNIAKAPVFGKGSGISIGEGSSSGQNEMAIGKNSLVADGSHGYNISIGDGATVRHHGGVAKGGQDAIAIGHNSLVHSYINQNAGIAIGANALAKEMIGNQEKTLGFNQSTYNVKFLFFTGNIPQNPENLPSSIAVGRNAYARSGSINIGSKVFQGDLFDVTVERDAHNEALSEDVLATTVGTNSFTNGALASTFGAYSAATSKYTGAKETQQFSTQNFGSTIVGSLNGNLSARSENPDSGIANSIVGLNNTLKNSNASIAIGAGNEISNSIAAINNPIYGPMEFNALRDKLNSAMQSDGGSTLVIGGLNKADWTRLSQVVGSRNTLKGDEQNISTNNLLNGHLNSGSNVHHTTTLGSENTLENAGHVVIIGDNRTVRNGGNGVILGSQDEKDFTFENNDFVAIGHDTRVLHDAGVAIGSQAVSNTDKGVTGITLKDGGWTAATESTPAWTATKAAVSVGDTDNGVTRQITGVAAGTNDTDAVNVAQLKQTGTTINNRINNLSHHVDRVDHHARAGIASAMAAGALPQAYLPGKSMIAGGVATYRSASAVAFGLSSVSDDGSRIYKLNASANTEGDAGVAAGVGFQW